MHSVGTNKMKLLFIRALLLFTILVAVLVNQVIANGYDSGYESNRRGVVSGFAAQQRGMIPFKPERSRGCLKWMCRLGGPVCTVWDRGFSTPEADHPPAAKPYC